MEAVNLILNRARASLSFQQSPLLPFFFGNLKAESKVFPSKGVHYLSPQLIRYIRMLDLSVWIEGDVVLDELVG